jgi:hypothetical protein
MRRAPRLESSVDQRWLMGRQYTNICKHNVVTLTSGIGIWVEVLMHVDDSRRVRHWYFNWASFYLKFMGGPWVQVCLRRSVCHSEVCCLRERLHPGVFFFCSSLWGARANLVSLRSIWGFWALLRGPTMLTKVYNTIYDYLTTSMWCL